MTRMPRIKIIFTGGTISMRIDSATGGAIPALNGQEILALVPGIEKLASISHEDYAKLPGPHITPLIMWDLSRRVQEALESSDYDGVVITHGTDTLEETAFLLDLTLNSHKPVVLLGAMRISSELSWDGPHNLHAGVRVATHPNSFNRGVLVTMGDEIHAASDVTKTHTEHVNAFQSPDFGPVGFVDKSDVVFYRSPHRRQYIPATKIDTAVELLKVAAGADDRLLKWAVDSGAHGIVIEATGRGNVPPDVVPGIQYVIDHSLPIVLVSRCLQGRVLDTYGYPGGGRHLRQMGVIFAQYINGQKARIKLIVALGNTQKLDEIRQFF